MISTKGQILVAALVIVGAVLVPIWSVTYPPLTDYPNHLARMHVLMMKGADEFLNKYYVIRWAAIPNLAMDLTVPSLARLVGLESAGKLFLSAILVLLFTGTLALHHAIHRTWSAWPLVASLILFNPFFLWGFVNFLFGLGVALWLSALWILLRDTRIAWYVFPPAALCLFFMHLMPFGIYLVIIGSYEAGLALRDRTDIASIGKRSAQIASQALPALAVFLAASPTRGGQSGTLFSHLGSKVEAFSYVFSNYVPFLDFKLTFIPVVVLLTAGWAAGRLKVDRRMLLPMAAMVLIYFAIPNTLLTAGGAYRRFTVPVDLLFIASTSLEIRRRRVTIALAVALASIFMARMVVLERAWLHQDRELASLRGALAALPNGARLMPLFIFPGDTATDYRTHFPSMAVIDRGAFVPSMFAFEHQQPMVFSARAMAIMQGKFPVRTSFAGGSGPDWNTLTENYDYILLTGRRYLKDPLPSDLKEVASTSEFKLFQVVRKGP